MGRALLTLAAVGLLASPVLASEAGPPATSPAEALCRVPDAMELPPLPEPAPQATSIAVGPGETITCAYSGCHGSCNGQNGACGGTLPGQIFYVFQNAQLQTFYCNANPDLGPYRQCRSSRQWWMAQVDTYLYCGCG